LLILDEYWQANPQLQDIPIWYASKLASRALRVYQTYANMMNARIRAQMDISNPFSFKYIQNLKSIDVNSFSDSGPSVVFASPGMLQSGVSRQLFDRWAPDPKNGVMIAGYAVEHTLAKEIMNQPKEVVTLEGRRQPLNCLVDYVSFSAHVDFVQNRSFITRVDPKHIILVHGQKDEMGRLKSALLLQQRQLPEVSWWHPLGPLQHENQELTLLRIPTEQTGYDHDAPKPTNSVTQVCSAKIRKGNGISGCQRFGTSRRRRSARYSCYSQLYIKNRPT
jgi:predicted metal-dependent RNase